jgi:hypothetical protein
MGPRVCQLLATLCVTLSLTLFDLGGIDLTSGFCLRTLSFGNCGAHFEYGLPYLVLSRA